MISLYNLTRYYAANRLRPPRKTTLPEVTKVLLIFLGFVLFLVSASYLGESLDVLFIRIPFIILVWVFGLLTCFYRFAYDLEKLKSSSAT